MAMVAVASAQQPPVKVNVLNVCKPSADEQKELSSALAKVPGKPAFSKDYEVARGGAVVRGGPRAPPPPPVHNPQYSFKGVLEKLGGAPGAAGAQSKNFVAV